ncbi:hypothetical protein A3K82_02925 [Candidatus Pacearchaeota archaeon RBG_19FT_COMBO_34_9]|nr:MAG: hypothetical protein A3K82_02925 [Candidatus Pacearchaeota archaeon RBG_19FT_COMBO_34_9]OGJ17009.1 MAG: hypothetical protein A3K74_01305 [Candidatus Pacearchaeota archaeon RBG_13_33_26]
MKEKTKKIRHKIFRIIWIILGIMLAIIAFSAWIKMSSFQGSGLSSVGKAIGLAIFFMVALGIFVIYFVATVLFLLIRWVIKKIKKKRENKK